MLRFPSVLILMSVLAAGVAAAAPPLCTPLQDGAVACLDGKLCACRLDTGGSITARRAGARWDCGALRPACDAAAPASPGPAAGQEQQPLLPVPPPPGWR